MKRLITNCTILSVFLAFIFSVNLAAQPFSSLAQAKLYFDNKNIGLNSIEGIYSYNIDANFRSGSIYISDRNDSFEYTVAIVLSPDKSTYYVYDTNKPTMMDCKIVHLGGNYYSYVKLGKSSWEELFDIASFESFSLCHSESAGSSSMTIRNRFKKIYPTRESIERSKGEQNTQELNSSWSGSGFALKDGYVVTNYHVVEKAKTITVQGVQGNFNTKYYASVAATDKYNDLALLKINDSRFKGFGNISYSIKADAADVGEDAFVLGYPLTAVLGDEIKLTTGVISSRSGYQGDVSSYQISAPIQPGNSGGPLFDSKGNLIGIVNAKITAAENVSYAIKASYLKTFVENFTTSNILPSTNLVATLARPEQIKKLKNFVFLIKCSNTSTGSTSFYKSQGFNGSSSSSRGYSSNSSGSSKNTNYSSGSSSSSINEEMSLSRNTLLLWEGESFTLAAFNYGPSLSWKTDNPKVATVSAAGVVTGVKPGKTYIWAKGKSSRYCIVTVQERKPSSKTGSSNHSSSSSSKVIPKSKATSHSEKYSSSPGSKYTIHSKEATIKVGEEVYAQLLEGKVEKWDITSKAAEYVTATSKGSLLALKPGTISIWGYIASSPTLFKLTIVDSGSFVARGKAHYLVTTKDFTMYEGDQITARVSEGYVSHWQIETHNRDYVSADGDVLLAKKAGRIVIWGYVNNVPTYFQIKIKAKK